MCRHGKTAAIDQSQSNQERKHLLHCALKPNLHRARTSLKCVFTRVYGNLTATTATELVSAGDFPRQFPSASAAAAVYVHCLPREQ